MGKRSGECYFLIWNSISHQPLGPRRSKPPLYPPQKYGIEPRKRRQTPPQSRETATPGKPRVWVYHGGGAAQPAGNCSPSSRGGGRVHALRDPSGRRVPVTKGGTGIKAQNSETPDPIGEFNSEHSGQEGLQLAARLGATDASPPTSLSRALPGVAVFCF